MLKGIPACINPDLLKALAEMGHGDQIVLADDFFPATSMAQSGVTVHADGIGAAEMLDAILRIMPLDTEFAEHPVLIMDMANRQGQPRPTVWDDFARAVSHHVKKGESCIGFIDRFAFYEQAKKAFAIVSTGERHPYGCVILQKGVN
ncbi:RbsD/FucU family protein [uncultured Mitsuokella sp.]|uniref:RbsD/FucU family protein n=1 Tax=uncultured Mitsuokella sp. TaxID=453120 RepID=UPI002623C7BD|nr:RbsD/FucU family protein [uncultured Mitsuokella sp.]